jgi:5-oxoprolinase (ATP-hydrolysing)
MTGKFHFSIDRGGTFTDVHCRLPDGTTEVVLKLLSEDPSHYPDAPTEGIRRILQLHSLHEYPRGVPVTTHEIGSIRMGTTVATNALLERNGERMALLVTKGFKDLLEIGNQSRPNIFDLSCARPTLLYETVVEIDERIVLCQRDACAQVVGVTGETVSIVKTPDVAVVRDALVKLRQSGITALAVCLMHAYVYGAHEVLVGKMASDVGYEMVALSHQVAPVVKIVPRAHTTCAAAYLTPKINEYLESFKRGFDSDLDKVPLTLMKSDGADINMFCLCVTKYPLSRRHMSLSVD